MSFKSIALASLNLCKDGFETDRFQKLRVNFSALHTLQHTKDGLVSRSIARLSAKCGSLVVLRTHGFGLRVVARCGATCELGMSVGLGLEAVI